MIIHGEKIPHIEVRCNFILNLAGASVQLHLYFYLA